MEGADIGRIVIREKPGIVTRGDFRLGKVMSRPLDRSGHWTVGDDRFQATRWSLIDALGGDAGEGAMDRFCRLYWYPAYCFVRRSGHGREEARDLVQDFFAGLLEKDTLSKVRHEQAKFRTFFITLLKRHLIDAYHRSAAQKRGGGQLPVPLSWDEAESRFIAEGHPAADPVAGFERQWAGGIMVHALGRLRSERAANARHAAMLAELEPLLARDPEPGEYERLAAAHGTTGGALRTTVLRLRQRFRDCVLDELRAECGPAADLEEARRDLIAALRG